MQHQLQFASDATWCKFEELEMHETLSAYPKQLIAYGYGGEPAGCVAWFDGGV